MKNVEVFECKCGACRIMRNVEMWPYVPVKCPKCGTETNNKRENTVLQDKLIVGVLLYSSKALEEDK